MFERIASFFKAASGGNSGAVAADDPRVAAAALLFHVMDADGERRAEEKTQLRESVADAFGLDGKDLAEVLTAGEAADRDAVDLYAFTSVIKRELDEEQRREFIEIMWEVVFADGVLHELEDNTVWRVAELIAIENRDRVLLRQKVAERRGIKDDNG